VIIVKTANVCVSITHLDRYLPVTSLSHVYFSWGTLYHSPNFWLCTRRRQIDVSGFSQQWFILWFYYPWKYWM